jgi:hypothetical protein
MEYMCVVEYVLVCNAVFVCNEVYVCNGMRQVGGFLCVFSISLTNKIDRHHISVKDETRKISHCGNNSKIKMKIQRNLQESDS